MRTIRNALLSAVAAAILPMSGLGMQAATIAVEIGNRLVKLVDQAERGRVRDFREAGVRIRSAPGTGTSARGLGNPGDRATIHRMVVGEMVRCPNGSANSEWFDITNRRTSVSGFVSGCFI
ncbi:hypothetical protein [Saccharopolyspora thermophila]|uniref:SH3 domain-containing protein n=1 Tax=Saccharopolyspora thermophila TaxID=89367 RepID=A0ABP3M2I5_9PSEU